MKNFIKENWKTFAVGLIALLVCTFGVIQFANKFEEKELAKLHNANHDKEIENRVKSAMDKKYIAEIDSLKRKNFRIISELIEEIKNSNSKIIYYKKSYVSAQNKADSLAKNKPECNDVAKAYKNVIDTLKMQNIELDSLNEKLDNEAELYSTNLYLTEQQLKIANNSIQRKDSLILIKDNYISKLEKDKSKYWKGFWTGYKYGFGSAVVLETGALILLNR